MTPRRRAPFQRVARVLLLPALPLLLLVGCLPEPTPPVERPHDLGPIGVTRPEPPRTEPRRGGALRPPPPTAGPLVFAVTATAARQLLELPLVVGTPVSRASEQRPLAVLAVTANTRAELNLGDCGEQRCGGLARRASALDALRALATSGADAPIVVDTGDALAASLGGLVSDEPATVERAATLLAALGAMGLDAMLVNARDLRIGTDSLLKLAARHGVPLLSSNLVAASTQEPVFVPHRLIERGALKLGLVGLSGTHRSNPRFLGQLGLEELDAEEALAQAVVALREEGAAAVVLLSGVGVRETESLLSEWADPSTRPDLALVSGTSRLTAEPSWAAGVAVLEAGDRGRQLLVVRFYADEHGVLRLTREPGEGARLVELLAVLRRISALGKEVEQRTSRSARNGTLIGERVASMKRERANLVPALSALDDPLGARPAIAAGAALDVEVVELPETLVPDARIQALVDAVEQEGAATKRDSR